MGDPAAAVSIAALVCPLLGVVLSLLPRVPIGRRLALAHSAATLAGLLAAIAALRVLFGAAPTQFTLFTILPGSEVAVRLTPLAAFFWLLTGLASCAVSIFAIGYTQHYLHRLSAGWLGAIFNLFLLSLLLVTAADNALGFVVIWETMALLSYLLVVYDHHDRTVVRAGLLYAVMTHAGTACITLCFLLLAASAPGNGLSFSALHLGALQLDNARATAVFLLALVGFGTKAGVMPLHVWLPRAHPAAPSHVSALMSGVMIKTGIYGMILIWFVLLPAGPLWWGLLVLALGALSAVVGALYALLQQDLKRMLAYSSVEHIGIILLALGAALLLRSSGQNALAAFALAAALFHTLSHALFKSLLFLAAGAVQHAAHSRDLERLGGLLRQMPWTGACFLIGAAALSALPPLNGFAGEWLIVQSLFSVGLHVSTAGIGGCALLAAAALGLTGALAGASSVKAMGIVFLGQPRTPSTAAATETGVPERVGMAVLATACVALGVLPAVTLRTLDAVTVQIEGLTVTGGPGSQRGPFWQRAVTPPGMLGHTTLHPLALLLALAGLLVLGAVLTGALQRSRIGARVGPTWNCGLPLTPRMQYSGASFSQPLKRMFSAIVWPQHDVQTEYAHAPYFIASIHYSGSLKPIFTRFLYRPVHAAFLRIVALVRLLQNGSVHTYLAYIFVALVITLAVIR